MAKLTLPARFGRSLRRRASRWLIRGLLLWVAATALLVLTFRFVNPPLTAVMLSEPGPFAGIDYRWVDRPQIAVSAARAVIAAEDQKLLIHHGIDFDALAAAVRDYRRGEPLRGASTLNQQVAKNLFLWNGRSFLRKGLEAWFALLIDLLWSKQRILEVYLNIAEFGPDIFGVEAAARDYFGHSAADLTPDEAAMLAAVLPSPKRLHAKDPGPYLRTRRAEILRQIDLLSQRGHYLALAW
jgi:monofunctional biosynthetic peptidoglycan transglycosylase